MRMAGKKLRVAVCDDEILLLPQLTAMIQNLFLKNDMEVQADSFSTSAALLQALYSRTDYDAYFLDIDIPELDGIALADRIMGADPEALIIFVSGRDDLILDTFRVRPLGFVRKSNFSEDLPKAMDSLLKHFEKPVDVIVPFRDELGHGLQLNLTRLMYVEAQEKYQKLVSIDREEMLRCSIQELENALSPHGVVRIHRSYLVNLRYVYRIDAAQVVLDSRQSLPMSRHRKKEIMQRFLEYSSL